MRWLGRLGWTKRWTTIESRRRSNRTLPKRLTISAVHVAGAGEARSGHQKNFRNSIALRPPSAATLANMGSSLRAMGLLDDSSGCFQRSVSLEPKNADAWSNLGSAHRELRELDDSIAAYRRALQLRPGAADIHSNLVYTLWFHPDYPPAPYPAGTSAVGEATRLCFHDGAPWERFESGSPAAHRLCLARFPGSHRRASDRARPRASRSQQLPHHLLLEVAQPDEVTAGLSEMPITAETSLRSQTSSWRRKFEPTISTSSSTCPCTWRATGCWRSCAVRRRFSYVTWDIPLPRVCRRSTTRSAILTSMPVGSSESITPSASRACRTRTGVIARRPDESRAHEPPVQKTGYITFGASTRSTRSTRRCCACGRRFCDRFQITAQSSRAEKR